MFRNKRKSLKAFISSLLMSVALISPTLALADFSALSIIGNPLTAPTAPYLILNGLTGQSACTVSILAPFGGTISVEGLYTNTNNTQWTGPLTVYSPDGTVTVGTTIAAAGNYIFNCGNMNSVRADGTAATGTPTVTLNASGGINVIAKIPTGGGGTVTAVTATGPIVSSGGTTPNISCPTCDTGPYVSSITPGPSGNLTFTPSTGAVVGDIVESPTFTGPIFDTSTSYAYYASNGGSGNVPRALVFNNSLMSPNTTTEIGSNNTATVDGVPGQLLAISNYNNSSATRTNLIVGDMTGDVGVAGYLAAGNLTASVGDCLEATTNGEITSTGTACGTGSGTVTAVTGSGKIMSSGGTTPNITCPTCGSGTVTSVSGTANQITSTNPTTTPVLSIPTTFIAPGSIAATTSLGAGNLTSGDCLQSISGVITSASTNCPTGALGSVSSANNLIAASTVANAVTLTANETPTYTGTVTVPQLIDSGLSASLPVCSSGTKQLTTAGCPAGTGTVTSVSSANNLLSVSSPTTTPVLTANETPIFTGLVTSQYGDEILNSGGGYTNLVGPGGYGTGAFCSSPCNQQEATGWSTSGSGVGAFIGSDNTKTTQGVADTYFQFGENNNGTITIGTAINPATGAIGTTGPISSGSLTSGDYLQAGTNGVIENAVTPPVTSVTGTGVISSTGGQTPVISYTGLQPTATAPTVQSFLAGTGTYTTPAGVKWIRVMAVGGGGGAAGVGGGTPGAGGTGGTTTFGTSLITLTGGAGVTAPNAAYGGNGGTATIAAGPLVIFATTGGHGGGTSTSAGGNGGVSCLGGEGGGAAGGIAGAGGVAATNSGSGGGGGYYIAGPNSSSGGGAGGCATVIINAPAATYAYAVGAAGATGTAGTGGNVGGAGGAGVISVEEHYNY